MLCFVSFRISFRLMDGAVQMVRWRVDGVEFHRLIGRGIYDVVVRARGNNDSETVADRVLHTIEDRFAFARFTPDELIQVMYLHTDLLTGFQAHHDELTVFRRVQNLSEIIVRKRRFLQIDDISFHSFSIPQIQTCKGEAI